MSTNNPMTLDPDRGYARNSYTHAPPERAGFTVVHVKGHYHGVNRVWVPDRWHYIRVDKDGMTYRGRGAKARMVADGVADPSIAAATDVERAIQNRESNPSPRRAKILKDRGVEVPKAKRPYRRRRKLTAGATAVRREIEPRIHPVGALGTKESIWVPVRQGELIFGWMDLRHGVYVTNHQLPPEGLIGAIRRDASLTFTEKFQDMLDILQKVS